MTKVVWSKNAKEELESIKTYWTKKNNSNLYSKKIDFHIDIAVNLLKRNPKLGIKSNVNNVRMRLILKNYYLIYEANFNQINILQFWDNRQNPIKINFKRN